MKMNKGFKPIYICKTKYKNSHLSFNPPNEIILETFIFNQRWVCRIINGKLYTVIGYDARGSILNEANYIDGKISNQIIYCDDKSIGARYVYKDGKLI